jgi:hypothetical protein
MSRHHGVHFGGRHVLEAGPARIFKGVAATILTSPCLGWG